MTDELIGPDMAGGWLRYVAASAAALAADLLLFNVLLILGVGGATASAGGYTFGIGAHWLLSSRAVFAGALAEAGASRRRQQAQFLASALVGLALTTGIVGAATAAGLDPRLAKLAAIAVSFQATWLLRRHWVFG